MRRLHLCRAPAALALAALAVVWSSTAAQGAFIIEGFNDFTGGAIPGFNDPDLGDGTVNFAVFDNTAGDFLATIVVADTNTPQFFGGTPANLATDRFIYLYQAVNTNPLEGDESSLDEFQLRFDTSLVESFGYFLNSVFNEETEGEVGPTTNPRLDTQLARNNDPDSDSEDPVVNTLNAGVRNPTSGSREPNSLSYMFEPNTLDPDAFSSVLFLTSDFGPVFGSANLNDGGFSVGTAPVPTPVPATLALLLTGLPGFGLAGVVWRRRQRQLELQG